MGRWEGKEDKKARRGSARTRGPEDTRAGDRGGAKVQIGAKLLCKGAKVGDRSRLVDRLISGPVGQTTTSWQVDKLTCGQEGKEAVQRCKSERSSCTKVGYESIEYRVLSIGRVRKKW